MHMAQLMPPPLTVSCFTKIQIGVTFLVPAHLGSPGKRAVKRVCMSTFERTLKQHLVSYRIVLLAQRMCKQPILCVLIDGSAYRWLSASKHRKSIKSFSGRRALKENGAFSSRRLVATVKDTVKWFSQKMTSTFRKPKIQIKCHTGLNIICNYISLCNISVHN